MVVCKYWLDGRCRFGSNCRFEHQSRDASQRGLFSSDNNWQGGGQGQRVTFNNSFGGGGGNNQYKWSANNSSQGSERSVTDIVKDVPNEMKLWETSKMWPFSCVSLEKDLPSLPDFQDTSPEEMRLEAYQAKATGSMAVYLQKCQALMSEFQGKRQHLKQMTMDMQKKLVAFVEEAKKNKSSTNSTFGASSNQPKPGLFGASGSSTGLFGKSTTATSAFGGGSTPCTSVFGSSAAGGQGSLFGSSAGTTGSGASLFGGGSTTGQSSVFGGNASTGQSSVFGSSGGTLFGKPANIGGGNSVFGGGNQNNNQQMFGAQSPAGSRLFGSAAAPSSSPNLFGSGTTTGQQAPNLFGCSPSAAPSLFGKPPGTPQQTSLLGPAPGSTSLLGPAPGSTSLLGQAPGSTSLLGPGPTAQPSVFGNPSSTPASTQQGGAPNLFGKPAANPSMQPQNLFGGPPGGQQSGGLFGKGETSNSSDLSSTLFTPLSELTEAEKAAFEAKSFQLGKIPLRPPPKELVGG